MSARCCALALVLPLLLVLLLLPPGALRALPTPLPLPADEMLTPVAGCS